MLTLAPLAVAALRVPAVAAPPTDLPDPPAGYAYLTSADGTYLTGADGAYLYGVA